MRHSSLPAIDLTTTHPLHSEKLPHTLVQQLQKQKDSAFLYELSECVSGRRLTQSIVQQNPSAHGSVGGGQRAPGGSLSLHQKSRDSESVRSKTEAEEQPNPQDAITQSQRAQRRLRRFLEATRSGPSFRGALERIQSATKQEYDLKRRLFNIPAQVRINTDTSHSVER